MGFEALGTLAIAGVLSAISVFVLLWLIDIRKCCGYHIIIDVVFSVGLTIIYAGTFSGMITAFVGGLALSIMLYTTKRMMGYAKYYRRYGWRYFHD